MSGQELVEFFLAGLEIAPFAILGYLAYRGERAEWARAMAVGWLGLLLLGAVGLALLLGVIALGGDPSDYGPEEGLTLAALAGGLLFALALGATGFLRAQRAWLARLLPLSPDSFVHTVAWVTVLTLTLIGVVPLLVLGEPPLLAFDGEAEMGADLRADLYGLTWLVPATLVAVGLGVRRDLAGALARLGLTRPTRGRVLAGAALAVAMALAFELIDAGIAALFEGYDWPQTDEDAVEELISYAISPVGALVIGVTAGLGEELAVRGALQPRFGILLSNLFFTSMHGFQYGWDGLLSVFLAGLVLGLIRRRSNTSTSAIVHGGYDFLLIMADYLELPSLV